MRLAPLALLWACSTEPGTDADVGATGDTSDTAPGASGDEGDEGSKGDLEGWGEPTELTLSLQGAVPPIIRLDLDKDEVGELFGDRADEVVLLELDPTALLTDTLDRVKVACGDDWRNDKPDPVYDCTLTRLGRQFAGSDGTWQTSPEFQLVRILTMTPANAKVADTSVETLAAIADFLGLGGGFSQILADGLDIARTEEFLDTAVVAAGLREGFLASHPEVRADGRIPVTLEDGLTDLASFGRRFGPSGAHPGIVDPTQPVQGEVLTDAFRMVVEARSNLRVVDGLDLSGGKDYIGVIDDDTPPTFDDEIEFAFDDPDGFFVEGVADRPTVDLRFVIGEHPTFVPACGGKLPSQDCRDNLPGNPIGAGTVWHVDPWTIESGIARAGRVKYGGLVNQECYVACALVAVDFGQNGDPPGFGVFDVALGIGNPPRPQYAWELLSEVAQRRLHDAGIAEGDASVAIFLEGLDVGIDGAEVGEAMRPFLAGQGSLLSDFLLGDFRKNDGPVDLYYRRTADGQPTLFWVTPDDLAEGDVRTYDQPGLYDDAGFTFRVSSTVVPGADDVTREKWRVPPGQSTVYAMDDEGRRYRLDVTAPDLGSRGAEISVLVREALP